MSRYTKTEQAEATERLKGWLKPGDTVFTILRHVSRSGMSRNISVVIVKDGNHLHPNHAVSRVLGQPLVEGFNDSIKMGGAGMDMGFALVYHLGARLYPRGVPCAGTSCNSNEHRNAGEHRDNYSPLQTHTDGGYAFKHEWL